MSIKNEYQQHNFLSNTGFGTVNPTEKVDVSGNVNVSTGNTYKINGTDVLTGSSLGGGITSSSLTSVGTLSSLATSGITTLGGSLFLNARPIVRSGEGNTLTLLDLDFNQISTADGIIRLFRNTNTTGSTKFEIFRGNNTTDINHSLASEGNSYLGIYGNIGIGTNNPQFLLDIVQRNNAYIFHNSLYSDDTSWGVEWRTTRSMGTPEAPQAVTTGTSLWGIYIGGQTSSTTRSNNSVAIRAVATENFSTSAQGAKLDFGTTTNGSTTRNIRMTIENNGHVGIGTTSPTQRLHVYTTSNPGSNGAQVHYGDGTYGLFISNGTGTGFSPVIKGVGNDTNDSGLQFIGALTNDTTANIGILMDARTSTNTAIANAKVLQLNNYTTNLITVNANGSVGIGTTNPLNTLHVKQSSDGSVAAQGILLEGLNGKQFNWSYVNTTYQGLTLNEDRTNVRMIVAPGGNIGIGTTTPSVPLEVNGAIKSSNSAVAWVSFDGTPVTPTIQASYNITSVSKTSTGQYTINFTTAQSNTNYGIVASGNDGGSGRFVTAPFTIKGTSNFNINCGTFNSNDDFSNVGIAVFNN